MAKKRHKMAIKWQQNGKKRRKKIPKKAEKMAIKWQKNGDKNGNKMAKKRREKNTKKRR